MKSYSWMPNIQTQRGGKRSTDVPSAKLYSLISPRASKKARNGRCQAFRKETQLSGWGCERCGFDIQILIKSGSLAVANAIRYVFQRRVEGKQQLQRINQLTPERADIETDSDSPTSPMSEHQQLEEPSRMVNDVLRHPPTNQPQVLPKNAKILSSTQGTQGMQL